MVLIFGVIFFLPIGKERFMTAIDATLDLSKWYAQGACDPLPAAGILHCRGDCGIHQPGVGDPLLRGEREEVAFLFRGIGVGAILAVCSCTILPLFTSIYKRGAGLGPAVAFLYSGPAISILSIILTWSILGTEMGIARMVGAILFSVVMRIDHGLYLPQGGEGSRRNR